MSRPLRIEFPGALYHITSRGNAQQAIFLAEKDFTDFLNLLCGVVKRYHFLLHGYCLMGNHYHLLIETPEGNLARGMRQLNGLYTQRFNKSYHRVGHLLQGRYKSILIDKDNYLLELSRYIVLNPLRANIVQDAQDWKWSSYQQTIGTQKGIPCLTTAWILSQFSLERKTATKAYHRFVLSGIETESPLQAVKGQLFLGQDSFIAKIKHLLQGKERLKEISREQRYITRPPLNEIFQGQDKKSKEKEMYKAYQQYGYTLKEIAEYIDIHYSTVSRVIKRIERER